MARNRVLDYLAWEEVHNDLKKQEGEIEGVRMASLRISLDKAKKAVPGAIRQAYCIVVTVGSDNEVQAFKISVPEADDPLFSLIKGDSQEPFDGHVGISSGERSINVNKDLLNDLRRIALKRAASLQQLVGLLSSQVPSCRLHHLDNANQNIPRRTSGYCGLSMLPIEPRVSAIIQRRWG